MADAQDLRPSRAARGGEDPSQCAVLAGPEGRVGDRKGLVVGQAAQALEQREPSARGHALHDVVGTQVSTVQDRAALPISVDPAASGDGDMGKAGHRLDLPAMEESGAGERQPAVERVSGDSRLVEPGCGVPTLPDTHDRTLTQSAVDIGPRGRCDQRRPGAQAAVAVEDVDELHGDEPARNPRFLLALSTGP